MSYDPSITQRVRHAVSNATDAHLAVDMLLEHNERQDQQIGAIEDTVKDLAWHHARRLTEERMRIVIAESFREANLRIALNKWILITLGTPIAGAAVVLIIDTVKSWHQ